MGAVIVAHVLIPYPDGRRTGCVRCSYPASAHPDPPPPTHVERDLVAEHSVLDAAKAGSALDYAPLWTFASGRAHPGGVRLDRSLRREVLEELADALHYLVWEIVYVLEPRARLGDAVAATRIPSRLGAIRKLIETWDILHLP